MTIEEKYHHAIIVLQAIAQRIGYDEWSQAEAFCDCREAAIRCLLKLGEPTKLYNHDISG